MLRLGLETGLRGRSRTRGLGEQAGDESQDGACNRERDPSSKPQCVRGGRPRWLNLITVSTQTEPDSPCRVSPTIRRRLIKRHCFPLRRIRSFGALGESVGKILRSVCAWRPFALRGGVGIA